MSEGFANIEFEGLHEKCAVALAYTKSDEYSASALCAESLFATQHRGPEATGIVSAMPDNTMIDKRGPGLVSSLFDAEEIARLSGSMAIGHNRYSTSGDKTKHLQPCIDTPLGFSFAHNGNIPDTSKLEIFLDKHNIRNPSSKFNDSEMMSLTIAQHLREGLSLPDAIEKSTEYFTGAYSCVAMHDGVQVAFRDPCGIRPLEYGTVNHNAQLVSSETCGLEINDAVHEFSVDPGEMIIINEDGVRHQRFAEANPKLDIFEIVYFARHDSKLYGQSVGEIRRNFGRILARNHPPITDDWKNVLVVGVPDTSTFAAEGYADELNLKHGQPLVKNRYIGRTFLNPSQDQRVKQLRRKHNFVEEAIYGKDLILIDDSIVRLNTYPRLVRLALDLGARSVQTLVASAPVRFPDFYGIDTAEQGELAAANMTIEQMRLAMSSNYLGFLTISQMVEATGKPASMFNLSSFTGEYPIDIGWRNQTISTPVSKEYME